MNAIKQDIKALVQKELESANKKYPATFRSRHGAYGVMLEEFEEVSKEETDRVCYLIEHHHTYTGVDGEDYRILLEADFLVNAYEDKLNVENILAVRENVFRTKNGTKLLNMMYNLE